MSEPTAPLPYTTVQLAGHTSSTLVEGLTSTTKSPWLLAVVLLNVLGIVAAVYFLNVLIKGQQEHLNNLIEVQQTQRKELLAMHKDEFDALLEVGKSNFTLALQAAQLQPMPSMPPSRRGPQ